MSPSIYKNVTLLNIYDRQISLIKKILLTLHEDLQLDYEANLNTIM
ncbi:MAG: hypothetical protein JXR51_12035 [Bacteroidales bacterium]|nr:hypothetical protein [Bacteroidales bacterium]MBN2757899.1 hypothetical protein [Bacteroidales bacterium]